MATDINCPSLQIPESTATAPGNASGSSSVAESDQDGGAGTDSTTPADGTELGQAVADSTRQDDQLTSEAIGRRVNQEENSGSSTENPADHTETSLTSEGVPADMATQRTSGDDSIVTGVSRGTTNLARSQSIREEATAESSEPVTLQPAVEAQLSPFGLWNPIWLQFPILIGFVLVFVAISAALIFLLVYSQLHHGLVDQNMSRLYAWKFGPTAVFVVLSALWSRVDYCSRALAPWYSMGRDWASVKESLTLDYLSPLSLVSLKRSVHARHWHVVITLTGLFLLKLAVVLSTDIFVLDQLSLSRSDIEFSSQFKFGIDPGDVETAGTKPAYLFYAINLAGLPQPNWTTNNFAVQPFGPKDWLHYPPNSTISAEVPVFYPSFDCAIANATASKTHQTDGYSAEFEATLDTEDCHVEVQLEAVDSMQYSQLRQLPSFPSQNYVSTWQPIGCHSNTTQDRYFLTVSRANSDLQVETLAAAICSPNYTISTSSVMADLAQFGQYTSLNATGRTESPNRLKNLSLVDLAFVVQQAFVSISVPASNTAQRSENSDAFFQYMSYVHGRSADGSTLEPFLDPVTLVERADQVWSGVATQFAATSLLKSSDTTFNGRILYQSQRLVIREATTIVILVLFISLALLTVALILSRPIDLLPRDPFSIAGLAALTMLSDSVRSMLAGLGASRTKQLESQLSNHNFRLVRADGGFIIDSSPRKAKENKVGPRERATSRMSRWWRALQFKSKTKAKAEKEVAIKPWRSLALKTYMRVIVLALLVTTIAVLEVLQRLSDTQNGFSRATISQSKAQYATSYIPALFMTTLSLFVDALDSSTCTLSPYRSLKRGKRQALHSVSVNVSGKLAPVRFWRAARSAQWAAAFTTIAGLTATFFTIVVSALYTSEYVSKTDNLALSRLDTFDINWQNSISDDRHAGVLTNVILYNNVGYPRGTYEDLVFPALQVNGTTSGGDQTPSSSFVTLTLPAVRARLNCSVTTGHQVRLDEKLHAFNAGEPGYVKLYGTFPNTCPGGNGDAQEYSQVIWLAPPYPKPTGPQRAGNIWGLHVNGSEWTTEEVNPWTFYSWYPDNPPNCPSLAFNLGVYNVTQIGPNILNATFKLDAETTLLACWQMLEQVNTLVTFSYPDMSIDLSRPPVPDENNVTALQSESSGSVVQEYQVYSGIRAEMEDDNGVIGPFWNAVLKGKFEQDLENLLGAENSDKMVEEAQKIYGLYMAQAINSNMRVQVQSAVNGDGDGDGVGGAPAAPSPQRTFTGILKSPELRIQQNSVPKLILQILLAVVCVCAMLSWYFLGNTRDVIYHNPCTLAGVVSMLVDGGFYDAGVLPDEAQRWNDGEMERRGAWAGWRFGCGWREIGGGYADSRFGIWARTELERGRGKAS